MLQTLRSPWQKLQVWTELCNSHSKCCKDNWLCVPQCYSVTCVYVPGEGRFKQAQVKQPQNFLSSPGDMPMPQKASKPSNSSWPAGFLSQVLLFNDTALMSSRGKLLQLIKIYFKHRFPNAILSMNVHHFSNLTTPVNMLNHFWEF